MIRLIIIAIFLVLFLIISLPILLIEWIIGKFNPDARDHSSLRIVQWALRVIIVLAGVKLTVIGEENVPKEGAVLYIGNHRSYFDIVLTYARCPNLTGYIAKKELNKLPVINLWMRNLYCLFLDRENMKEGLKTILTGIAQLKKGVSVYIFPEGTRNKNPNNAELLPFHEGSFRLATKSGCPIIPVTLTNTDQIFEAHFPFIKSTQVTLEYGKPIIPSELSKEEQKKLGEYTRNLMIESLKKNCGQA